MIPYHLMNVVRVLHPRWHDRVILPKVSKFKKGSNIITIEHRNYSGKYFMHSATAAQYPQETKVGRFGKYAVYVIPLDDLVTIQEHQDIVKTANELFV